MFENSVYKQTKQSGKHNSCFIYICIQQLIFCKSLFGKSSRSRIVRQGQVGALKKKFIIRTQFSTQTIARIKCVTTSSIDRTILSRRIMLPRAAQRAILAVCGSKKDARLDSFYVVQRAPTMLVRAPLHPAYVDAVTLLVSPKIRVFSEKNGISWCASAASNTHAGSWSTASQSTRLAIATRSYAGK